MDSTGLRSATRIDDRSAPGAVLDRWWRVCATGFCFLTFGVGGTLLSFTMFPLLRAAAGSSENARPLIRRALRGTFRFFIGMMRFVGVLTYEVQNGELLLPRGQLIVANHPTLLDIVFLLSLIPDATCVVKRGLWRNPFLRWPVAWAGYIPNSECESLVANTAETLRNGHSLVMFPEGSRTTPGKPMSLKRGAAQVALASGAPVLPVTISCVPLSLTKANPWYRVPARPMHYTITAHPPIAAAALCDRQLPTSIAARRLTREFAGLLAPESRPSSL